MERFNLVEIDSIFRSLNLENIILINDKKNSVHFKNFVKFSKLSQDISQIIFKNYHFIDKINK